jgi:hypothetical protein
MAQILEEDVHSSVDCVVYLCNKLHINQPGTACHSKWETLKTTALQALFDSTLRTTVDKLIAESTGLLAAELAARVTWPITHVFVCLFTTYLTATLLHNHISPNTDNVLQYVDNSDVIARVCPTEKYLASIEKTRHLLMKNLDGSITDDEFSELTTAAIWQTRNFIYHFQPDTLPSVKISEISTSPLPLASQLLGALNNTEQNRSHGLADSDIFQEMKDIVMSMKAVVAAYPFRVFLKIMNRVAANDIGYPDGTKDSLNHHEMNICAVDVDTELARQLFSKMGFVLHPGVTDVQYDLVMLNVADHRLALQAFHEISAKELQTTVCPGTEQFAGMDSIPLLVAHLAYNLHFRVSLFVFSTPAHSLDLLEEDICAGLDCVEYLSLRLDTMQSCDCRSAWYTAKQMIKKYVSSRGRNQESVVTELNSVYVDVSRQIDLELSLRVSQELLAVFTYAYFIQRMARICISKEMLDIEDIAHYLDSCDAMQPDCISERWRDNINRTRQLLLKSFDETLSTDEILKVAEMAVWQSRNFIYHFQHEAINNEQAIGNGILPMRLKTVQRREDGTFEVTEATPSADQITDDHLLLPQVQLDEKTDEHEKIDEEKDVKACDESISDTDVTVCTDVESLPCLSCGSQESVQASTSDAVKCQGSGLLHSSQLRLTVLRQEISELQETLVVFNEGGATVAALNEAISEKKVEIDIVERFVSELRSMKCAIPGKVAVLGLGSLPQACIMKMLQDTVDGAHCQSSSQACLLSLVCQIVHLMLSVDMAKLCRRLGLVTCSKQDMMEMVKDQLTAMCSN